MYRTNKYQFEKSRISGGSRLMAYTTKNKLWFITLRRRIGYPENLMGEIYRANHHDILQVHSWFAESKDGGLVWSYKHLPQYVKQACLELTKLMKGGWTP